MGSRRPMTGKENMPGPGNYSAMHSQVKKRAPSAKIGSQARGFYKTNEVPGPGNYSPEINKKNPAYVFGSENRSRD